MTAGGTREPIDAVRVITNRSSGKQGYAIAAEAAQRGARVILVTTVDRPVPPGVAEVVTVGTAAEMEAAVVPRAPTAQVIVMAAAVADFRPKAPPARKLKKDEGPPDIVLEPTHDFLVDLGRAKPPGQVLVGFAAETDDLLDNARRKLDAKHLDLIVANDVGAPGRRLRARHQPGHHPRSPTGPRRACRWSPRPRSPGPSSMRPSTACRLPKEQPRERRTPSHPNR